MAFSPGKTWHSKLGTQNLALKTWDDFTTRATGEREGREDSTSRDRCLSIHVCACAGEEGGRAFTNSEKTMLASRRLPPARYWNTARARNKSFSDAWPTTWTGVNKKASAAGAAQVRPLSLVLTFSHTTAAEGTEPGPPALPLNSLQNVYTASCRESTPQSGPYPAEVFRGSRTTTQPV